MPGHLVRQPRVPTATGPTGRHRAVPSQEMVAVVGMLGFELTLLPEAAGAGDGARVFGALD